MRHWWHQKVLGHTLVHMETGMTLALVEGVQSPYRIPACRLCSCGKVFL